MQSNEYAMNRNLDEQYYIIKKDVLVRRDLVLKKVGYIDGVLWLHHESFKLNEYVGVYPHEILRDATTEEILSDIPNFGDE